MIGITAAIQAFCSCIEKFLQYKNTAVEKQAETDIICDKKDFKKAVNLAEEIIAIARKYESSMSKLDRRKLKSLVKRFNKVD
jgi:hypothetical protein